MTSIDEIIDGCRARPGDKIHLKDFDPDWFGHQKMPKDERKALAEKWLAESVKELDEVQEKLYAAHTWSVLVILQALDAAGKDGTIEHVMSGLNPQGCQVTSFKRPSQEELDHDFLWRQSKALPRRGHIGIFNRSHYEEVLVVKVHPEYLADQHIPGAKPNKDFWAARYEDINNFERHLARSGTLILKFFLHVSKEEQRQRLLERANNPEKYWKFSAVDVQERESWADYQAAYEDAISATSTKEAPWYIVPADHKWACRAIVATVLARAMKSLDLKLPETSARELKQIEEARKILERDK